MAWDGMAWHGTAWYSQRAQGTGMTPSRTLPPSTSDGTNVPPSPVSPVGARPSGCPRGPQGDNSLPATARCCSRRCPRSPRLEISLGSARHPVPSCPPVSPGTGYGSPVPPVSPPSPGNSYLSRGCSPPSPTLSLCPPGPGYESLWSLHVPFPGSTPCPACPPARVVLLPGMSPFSGCPFSRDVPLPGNSSSPGKSLCPRCPLARVYPLYGMSSFPG